MYAVVRIAGFQYLVAEGETVTVPRLEGEPGSELHFDDVLLVRTEDKVVVGRPRVEGASVSASIVSHPRAPKVMTFKFTRRENYRRKRGHRQPLTRVKVTKISPGS